MCFTAGRRFAFLFCILLAGGEAREEFMQEPLRMPAVESAEDSGSGGDRRGPPGSKYIEEYDKCCYGFLCLITGKMVCCEPLSAMQRARPADCAEAHPHHGDKDLFARVSHRCMHVLMLCILQNTAVVHQPQTLHASKPASK